MEHTFALTLYSDYDHDFIKIDPRLNCEVCGNPAGMFRACDTLDPTGVQHHCCTAEEPQYCPTADYLAKITDVEVWAEGTEGDFHLEIYWIGAGDAN